MSFTRSNILLIVAAIIVALGAYWFFFSDSGNEPPVTAATAVETPQAAQFRRLVTQLGPISFDTSIFADPRFNVLVDLSTPVAPETAGRADPFAPLSSASPALGGASAR